MGISCKIIEGYLTQNDKILVGVSGGADSMCLLDVLQKAQQHMNFQLIAVHVNHKLRGEESNRDELFVKKYCEQKGIAFIAKSIDVEKHAKKYAKSIEQAARELRYALFDEIMQKEKATVLAVAHHKDDQAETVLMHIARGSSLKGARGMALKSGYILRPLLNFTRKDIEQYNKENKVPSIKDSSNDDINYSRNFFRHKVIPDMEKVYPDVVNAVCKFADKCAMDDDFINSCIPAKLIVCGDDYVKILNQVGNMHFAISSRIIKNAFEQLGAYYDIEQKHILQIIELFKMKNGNKISLPFKMIAFKEYDGIVITFKKLVSDEAIFPFVIGETVIPEYGEIKTSLLSEIEFPEFGDGNHYVDFESIPADSVWRKRQDGDIFAKIGSGNKKLNDYFTDKKIPQRLRDQIPILAHGNKILLIAGLDISDSVKITGGTSSIVKITYLQKK